MKNIGLFSSKWYHYVISAIYIASGIILIYKSSSNSKYPAAMFGYIIIAYGSYRIWRTIKQKNE